MKRLMPTVGCEADAVAFKEEEQVTALDLDSQEAGPTFREDGSWSVPADFSGADKCAPFHNGPIPWLLSPTGAALPIDVQ